MKAIITLFYTISGYTAILTMVIPIIGAIKARKHRAIFNFDMRLFEFHVYFATLIQFTSLVLKFVFDIYYDPLFRIGIVFHTLIFSYLLLTWSGFVKYRNLLLVAFACLLILGDYFFNNSRYPYIMIWADVIVLLVLSFLLSYRIDKTHIKLAKEFNFIHIGIYIYSIITIIGISPSQIELRFFGHFIHSLAIIISNYYFYRSFKCLSH